VVALVAGLEIHPVVRKITVDRKGRFFLISGSKKARRLGEDEAEV